MFKKSDWVYTVEKSYGTVEELRWGKVISWVVGFLVAIILLSGIVGTVGAGERGVKTRFSAVTGTVVGEGLYFKLPFIERVVVLDIKTQKEETQASAASKDLQMVNSTVALNYSIDPTQVAHLYQEVGVDYKVRIIDPAVQESIKASTAKFTAEELITKREAVKEDIKAALTMRLAENGIKVENLSIVNFDFSKSFNEAIEAKVTAEQNALAAKNKLAQIQYEAQQAVEAAKGKAEATAIEGQALRANPQVLELRAIEKWDGHMPQVTGGGMPLINLR